MSIDAFPNEKVPVDVVAASLEDGLPENRSGETQVNAAGTLTPPRKDAWIILIGGWLLLFTTFGYTNAFGVYEDVLTRAGTSSPSNISWMGSTQLFFFSAMALPAGRLLDKGYYRQTMVFGSVLFVFSLFMVSLAHPTSYYQMYLSLGIGMGLGCGIIYIPAVAIQAHYWKEHRALAMGIVNTGASVGGIVYPILLNQLLFKKEIGFGPSVRATGYLTLGILVVANCLMLTALSGGAAKRYAPAPELRGTFSMKAIVTDLPYISFVIGCFLVCWGLFFPYFYLQLWSTSHGLDATFGFYTLAILNAASVFGRTIPNLLADRFGPANALTTVCFGSGVLVLAMFGLHNVAGVAVFCVLYGFFSGGVLALLSPTLASLSPPSQIGVRLGFAFFIGSFCNLTGTPIDGALLTAGPYHWYRPIIYSATVMLVGTAINVMGRMLAARRRGTPWV